MKAASEGFKGFVDWMDSAVSESVEEREVEMSGLIAGFATRMCKRASNAQEETTPGIEASS